MGTFFEFKCLYALVEQCNYTAPASPCSLVVVLPAVLARCKIDQLRFQVSFPVYSGRSFDAYL
jgi:hypothetical protein